MDQQTPMQSPEGSGSNSAMGSNDVMIAIIGYIIFFVPLLVSKRSKFLTFHANQTLVLFLFAIVLNFVLTFLVLIPILGLILQLLRIVPFIFLILGIINASGGKMKELPIIGGITLIK